MKITVCNICRDPAKPTAVYTLARQGAALIEADLCEDDGALISKLVRGEELPPPAKPRPRKATPAKRTATPGDGRRSTPILTIAEIEKRKAEKRVAQTG